MSANNAPPTPQMRRADREVFSGGDDVRGSREGRRGARSEERPRTPQDREGDAPQASARPSEAPPDARPGERPGAPPQRLPKRPSLKEIKRGEGPFASQERELKPSPPTPPTQDPRPQGSGGGGGRLGGQLTPTHYQGLLPTLGPQDSERADGSIDHVEVPKGDTTALNTREYKYAHFFNRVKREVAARWFAAEALRGRDPRGNVFGVKDRHTVLSVTLYTNGSIARIEVLQESGLPFLDAEAVSSFERAQPFHNPPPGLADPDGLIRFKFGFYLEIGEGGFRFLP